MADITISNSSPLNADLNYTVTAQDATDGYVKFVLPTQDTLVGNVQLTDLNNLVLANTGLLVDDSVAGEVKIGEFAGIAEVITLTIAGDVVTTGTADVDIRGAGAVNVAISDGDTAIEVATAIAADTFTGWTVTSDGAVVTFTADVVGAQTGVNDFALTTSTGITGTFATPTIGYDASAFDLLEGTKIKAIISRDNSQFYPLA